MSHRVLGPSTILTAVMAGALLLPALAAAQSTPAAKDADKTAAKDTKKDAKPWTLAHTPDGQPDLQGYWTSVTFTPMERPKKYGNREFLSDKETDENYKAGIQHSVEFTFNNTAETPVYDSTVYGLAAWQNGIQPNHRTSLVVDPPDGQIPALTPEAAKAKANQKEDFNAEVLSGKDMHADGPEDLGLGIRCISFGEPPIGPGGYDSTYHIVQAPGYVLIEYEWNSETRLIPLDAGDHVSQKIHPWHGDSRGHWEGNTLVVDTTNFRPGAAYQHADAKELHITEYFTRKSATEIEYKFTINDPETWTKPWSAVVPLTHSDGPMFEYACSEGNNGMINILAGMRAEEREHSERLASPHAEEGLVRTTAYNRNGNVAAPQVPR